MNSVLLVHGMLSFPRKQYESLKEELQTFYVSCNTDPLNHHIQAKFLKNRNQCRDSETFKICHYPHTCPVFLLTHSCDKQKIEVFFSSRENWETTTVKRSNTRTTCSNIITGQSRSTIKQSQLRDFFG